MDTEPTTTWGNGYLTRKLAKQCQNCFIPDSKLKEVEGRSIKTCSGCNRTHYCSRECQKENWKWHKTMCKANQAAKELMKESFVPGATTYQVIEVSKYFKSWLDYHRPILAKAVISALEIKANNDNLFTHYLHLEVLPNFLPGKKPADIKRAFTFRSARRLPMELLLDSNAVGAEQIHELLQRSKEVRRELRQPGFAITLVNIPQVHLANQIVYGPDKNCLEYDEDWEATLQSHIDNGKVFKG
ncbi:hypothetical protein FA15DRAFT_668134 [Coprinopsis marcescibilis]|uniref:MYND-type domain-containing protein n=1 Tax=Coprinopsis marcescibilis TaxID=230819 RepID=A0A5C3KYY6_COPMA|nr:hypothetical protein FA15DRAFT_668134 [Coprinopsis marcescibilis]